MLKIIPVAFDSLGVRSMATFVETRDLKILIDPAAALGPSRYGLPPHPLEWLALNESIAKIKDKARAAEVLIVTHYHYDHYDPSRPELYYDKTVFIKHPVLNINKSQTERASLFLQAIRSKPKTLENADGNCFQIGNTRIAFSEAVCHGTDAKLGYVTQVSICDGDEKFLFSSDVEGYSLFDQTRFVLNERPNIIFADGPMTYMLGYRYSYSDLRVSLTNLTQIVCSGWLKTLVLDHHFLRDLNYKQRIIPLYETAQKHGVKIMTAAEYVGRKVEMLEALRKELYTPQNSSTGSIRLQLSCFAVLFSLETSILSLPLRE